MHTPLACSDYYGTSAPSPSPQLATNLPTSDLAGRKTGQPEMVPTFTKESIDQVGDPALSRQHRHAYAADFTVASPPAQSTGFGVDLTSRHRSRTAHRPLSTRFEPAPRLRDFNHWFTFVAPSGLACRTRTVWQCRSVPSLSGPLATFPGVPRIRLPPASIGPLRRTDGEGLSPPLDYLAPRGAQSPRATHA